MKKYSFEADKLIRLRDLEIVAALTIYQAARRRAWETYEALRLQLYKQCQNEIPQAR